MDEMMPQEPMPPEQVQPGQEPMPQGQSPMGGGLMGGGAMPAEQLPTDRGPTPDEEETPEQVDAYETMVAGLREHIFGAAEESIMAKLRESQDVTQDIGSMALALVMEAGKQAGGAGIDADFDLIISVGTEIIDDLLDMAEAMGVLKKVTDDDRERAMYAAVRGYLTSADVPPEEQEAAKQQLEQMTVEGDTQMAADRVQKLGEKEGVEPFAGAEQAAPQSPRLMGG